MVDRILRFFPGDGFLLGFFNWPFHLHFHLMVDELRTGLRSQALEKRMVIPVWGCKATDLNRFSLGNRQRIERRLGLLYSKRKRYFLVPYSTFLVFSDVRPR